MKLKVFLTITLLFHLTIYSQNFDITKGNIIKDRQFLVDKNEITACDKKGNFISVRPHGINGTLRNYYIEFFNKLNYEERKEVKTQNSTKILDVFIKEEVAHILIKEESKHTISFRFDLFSLTEKQLTQKQLISVDKSQKKLFKALQNDAGQLKNYQDCFLFSTYVVDDNTSYTLLKRFDNNYEPVFSEKIYPNKNIGKKNLSFLDAKWYNNKTYILFNIVDKEDSNYYKIIEVTEDKSIAKTLEIPIEHDTYELVNSKIINDHLIINGLFSHKKKGAFEGFTYYDIDLNTFTVVSKKLSKFYNEKSKTYFVGFFKSNRSIDIKDIFVDSENNTYLVGQFYSIKKQYVPIGIPIATIASGAFVAHITYNPISVSYKVFDDILISKIDNKGTLVWDNILELRQTKKIQSKYNKKDSSYFAYLKEERLNIILNGYINMEKDRLIVKQDKVNSKTNFYNIEVNTDGVITPKAIFPNKTTDILFKADGCHKVDSKIYNLGQGNMRKQLMEISY